MINQSEEEVQKAVKEQNELLPPLLLLNMRIWLSEAALFKSNGLTHLRKCINETRYGTRTFCLYIAVSVVSYFATTPENFNLIYGFVSCVFWIDVLMTAYRRNKRKKAQRKLEQKLQKDMLEINAELKVYNDKIKSWGGTQCDK